MIISASRRTDIPAFYAQWFMNRVRAGYCHVPNPFNAKQIAHVSLEPEDVDVIVFWTRHCRPVLGHLRELDQRGYRYYFLYTVLNNPRSLDSKAPPLRVSLRSFRQLAERIGPEKVIWRYDPILFSTVTDVDFHLKAYTRIAQQLKSFTRKSVISLATIYRKVKSRMDHLTGKGIEFFCPADGTLKDFMGALSEVAGENAMEIMSCAQDMDWTSYGICPGKCVGDQYIQDVFGLQVTDRKDPSQRKACGCVVSKDIGMYDTCRFGCLYCYATNRLDRARINYKRHDPEGESLLPSTRGAEGGRFLCEKERA